MLPRTPQAQTTRSDYSAVGYFNAESSIQGDSSIQDTVSRLSKKKAKSPCNVSKLSSKSKSRQGPRIAEVKALNEQLKNLEAKKQQDVNNKKQNENLVLRNFKKEIDNILSEVGLGPVQVKDKIEEDQEARRASEGTETTVGAQYNSIFSHEELQEEQVKVDVALVLFRLGFLNQLNQPRDANKSFLGIYVATLDDKEQKRAFKLNLFSILAAIQAINLKDHFKSFASFGVLQHHILEEITMQVDLSQLGATNNSLQSLNKTSPSKQQQDTSQEAVPCQINQLIEAVMQLTVQPFPFSLNHSHLVKMHLTFMSFFLNRKDNISRGYRQNLQDQEESKYKYSPCISQTQSSFSPNKQRAPVNEPNRYYDELKKNIKERAAKLSSLKAEKERSLLDECTFRPQVNPMSTKIAYKQVAELHVPQKEFAKTYMPDGSSGTNSIKEALSEQKIGSPGQQTKQQVPQSRLSNRINKLMHEYVEDKRLGRKQDVSTEQKDYEKSRKELSFRPNIAKSQLSLALAVKKSPQARVKQDQKSLKVGQMPLSMKRIQSSPNGKPSSPLCAKSARTIMFNKGAHNYSSKLKQQVQKRKKSPVVLSKNQKSFSRQKSPPISRVKINLEQTNSTSRNDNHDLLQTRQSFPETIESVRRDTLQTHMPATENSVSEISHSDFFPQVSATYQQPSEVYQRQSATGPQQQQMMFVPASNSQSHLEESTADFGAFQNSLRAPPSVIDIQGYSQNQSLAKPQESSVASADRNAGEINEDYDNQNMRIHVQEDSSDYSKDDLGGTQFGQIEEDEEALYKQAKQNEQEIQLQLEQARSDALWDVEENHHTQKMLQNSEVLPTIIEEEKTFETPQHSANGGQQAFQVSQSLEERVPFNSALCNREGHNQLAASQNLPLPYNNTVARNSNNIYVDHLQQTVSASRTSETTTEIPTAFLMPKSNSSAVTPSPVHESGFKDRMVFSNADTLSKNEWTSEFANVVQDMITINTGSNVQVDNYMYPGAPINVRDSLQKSYLQEQQRYSHLASSHEERKIQKMGTDPSDFKVPMRIVEPLDEGQEIAYEQEKMCEPESASPEPRDHIQPRVEADYYHGSPAKSRLDSESSHMSGQPYRYVNEDSQSEEQRVDEQQQHSFVDNTVSLGMLGEARPSQDDSEQSMPRLYRANTNMEVDANEIRISPLKQPRVHQQHHVTSAEQPRGVFRQIMTYEQDTEQSKEKSCTTEEQSSRSPKNAQFDNNSSLMSEVRISALDNFQTLGDPKSEKEFSSSKDLSDK